MRYQKSGGTLRVRTGLRCSPKRARRVPTPGIPDHFGYGRPRVPRSGPLLASAPGPPGVRFGAVCARRRHHMHVASRRRSRRGISFRMRPFTAQYTPSRCRGGGPLRPAWAPQAPESPRARPVSRSSPRAARRLSTCRSILWTRAGCSCTRVCVGIPGAPIRCDDNRRAHAPRPAKAKT